MEDQETMLKEALSDFLRKHSEEESISGIDEIVLSYMVSVLEELGSDLSAEEAFDLDGFIEMMDAYLPGFSNVNSAVVCEWMFHLAARLREPNNVTPKAPMRLTQPVVIPSVPDKPVSIVPQMTTSPPKAQPRGQHKEGRGGRRSRKSSEQAEAERCSGAEAGYVEAQNGFHDNSEGVEMLMEMFPSACSLELSHCLEVSHGDLEAAAQLILLRQEAGESFTAAPPKPHQSSAKKGNLTVKEDSKLKKSIINKYSYVDVDEAKKEHRPVMPKYEGKKLTRYLDNKVVSTKGEKFTEIKNAEEEEQKKKTTVNIKPAKQYRFH